MKQTDLFTTSVKAVKAPSLVFVHCRHPL